MDYRSRESEPAENVSLIERIGETLLGWGAVVIASSLISRHYIGVSGEDMQIIGGSIMALGAICITSTLANKPNNSPAVAQEEPEPALAKIYYFPTRETKSEQQSS